MGFDERAVRATVEDVVRAMLAIPREDALFPKGWWPGGCCEFAACAIAAVLEDRGLGTWTMVSGYPDYRMSGHSWLVWPGADGGDFFSIDVTVHQFDYAKAPFVDYGPSPSRAQFPERVTECSVWDWKWLGREDQVYRTTIRQVREALHPGA